MEEVVRKIIEIEREAQNHVAEGRSQMEKIRSNTENELKAVEDNILEMAENKIEQLRSRNRKEADDKIIRICENTALKMRMMEEVFEQNQEAWQKQIFNRIVGR